MSTLETIGAVFAVIAGVAGIISCFQNRHYSKDYILKQIEKETRLMNDAYNNFVRRYGVNQSINWNTKEGRDYYKHEKKINYWKQRL